jgi:NADH dehydrogenase FAD-containing subunit
MASTHEIIILGGHYAAIGTAHYLLRHVIPVLVKLNPEIKYNVTLVSPNTEFFFNIAAPRNLVSETLVPAKAIWLSIAEAFKSYDQLTFSHVIATALSVDPDKHIVKLSNGEDANYDALVIATGASYVSQLWQVGESETVTKKALASTRALLAKAKTVLIAGGGAVGVEVAGEISTTFPSVKLTLVSGSTRLLPHLTPYNSGSAESQLKSSGVETIHNVRVASSKINTDGTTTVVLANGDEKIVDVYLNATGAKPNSKFLPAEWLNESGHVIVDNSTLRGPVPGVYAIGDVASNSNGSLMAAWYGVPPLGTSIGIDLATASGRASADAIPFVQKIYKPMKDTQLVPTGPSGGVGQVAGWWIPSFLVWLIKSRTYLVEKAQGAVDGAEFVKP